jgi:DNA-directed RNA polymerase specialized sigma24 family protein
MDRERERTLILRWQHFKDEEAGKQLWEMVLSDIKSKVERYAEQFGLKSESQGVLDETFVELRKNVLGGKYIESKARLSSYSFGIATKKLLKLSEKVKRENEALKTYAGRKNLDEMDDPVIKEIIRREEIILWTRAISELPEPARTFFCLHEGISPCEETLVETGKFTIKQIAELNHKQRGWVWKRYTTARTILQKKLSGKVD